MSTRLKYFNSSFPFPQSAGMPLGRSLRAAPIQGGALGEIWVRETLPCLTEFLTLWSQLHPSRAEELNLPLIQTTPTLFLAGEELPHHYPTRTHRKHLTPFCSKPSDKILGAINSYFYDLISVFFLYKDIFCHVNCFFLVSSQYYQ